MKKARIYILTVFIIGLIADISIFAYYKASSETEIGLVTDLFGVITSVIAVVFIISIIVTIIGIKRQ